MLQVFALFLAALGCFASYFAARAFTRSIFVFSLTSLLAGAFIFIAALHVVMSAESKAVLMEQGGNYGPFHDAAFDAVKLWVDPWLLPPIGALIFVVGLCGIIGCAVRWEDNRKGR
jgi:hypothetical protein